MVLTCIGAEAESYRMYPGTFARSHPDRPAVIAAEDGAVLTYRQLDDASMRLARLLHDVEGLRPDDHIAVLSTNRLEVYGIYWAALRSGLFVTAINHHLSPDEVAYVVNDCGAKVLLVSADLAALGTAIVDTTPGVRRRLAFGGPVAGHDPYEEVTATQPAEPLAHQPRGADMLYSSGTTGRPKGIKGNRQERMLSEPDPYAGLFAAMYSFDENTVYYSAAPIYHAAPLRFSAFIHSHGGTVVMARGFNAQAALEHIERYGATHSQWVPTMFVRMLKLPPDVRASYDVSSMKVAVHAAAPCPVEVKRAMMDWWGPVLYEYYSSTEGNGVTFITPQDWLARPGSVGRAGLGTIRICADDGTVLPIGQTGVVYFDRDIEAFRYHNDDDKTLAARHPDHELWTTTGDIGHLDEDGYLYLTDRKAFMIISGGVNIYPQEIEDCLTMHPDVLDVAVIGLPDEEMGERVCAVVQVAPGVTPSDELAERLREFVRSRIAGYKVPRQVEFLDELPRSAAGKLVKRVLKERFARPISRI